MVLSTLLGVSGWNIHQPGVRQTRCPVKCTTGLWGQTSILCGQSGRFTAQSMDVIRQGGLTVLLSYKLYYSDRLAVWLFWWDVQLIPPVLEHRISPQTFPSHTPVALQAMYDGEQPFNQTCPTTWGRGEALLNRTNILFTRDMMCDKTPGCHNWWWVTWFLMGDMICKKWHDFWWMTWYVIDDASHVTDIWYSMTCNLRIRFQVDDLAC